MASRKLPPAARAMTVSDASATSMPSCRAMLGQARSTTSVSEGRRKSKRWQRDRMVAGTLCGSVVARTKTACAGGSSRVFSSALKASG